VESTRAYTADAKTKRQNEVDQNQKKITKDASDRERQRLASKQDNAKRDREAAEARLKRLPTGEDNSRVKAAMTRQCRARPGSQHKCGTNPNQCCKECCNGGLFCQHRQRPIDAEYTLLDREKALRLEVVKERDAMRESEDKATKELIEFTQSLKQLDFSKAADQEDVIETALRGSETAIKMLRSAIQTIVHFWDNLHLQCQVAINAQSGTIHQLELEKAKSAEASDKFFSSSVFQMETVEYLGR
jgi:hypothetical protein